VTPEQKLMQFEKAIFDLDLREQILLKEIEVIHEDKQAIRDKIAQLALGGSNG